MRGGDGHALGGEGDAGEALFEWVTLQEVRSALHVCPHCMYVRIACMCLLLRVGESMSVPTVKPWSMCLLLRLGQKGCHYRCLLTLQLPLLTLQLSLPVVSVSEG